MNRKGPDGKPARVRIWDTESWVANSDDRIAGVLAAMYLVRTGPRRRHLQRQHGHCGPVARGECTPAGKEKRKILRPGRPARRSARSSTSSASANSKELLFKNGLPWVMVFQWRGRRTSRTSTVVVLGDMGDVFGTTTCSSAPAAAWRK